MMTFQAWSHQLEPSGPCFLSYFILPFLVFPYYTPNLQSHPHLLASSIIKWYSWERSRSEKFSLQREGEKIEEGEVQGFQNFSSLPLKWFTGWKVLNSIVQDVLSCLENNPPVREEGVKVFTTAKSLFLWRCWLVQLMSLDNWIENDI